MKRRNFLKSSAIASTSLMVPAFLKDFSSGKLQRSRSGKTLVVIQLSGGNDGLNTIVPFQNDLYYKFRPDIGIKASEVLKISDQIGLNPALAAFRELYDDGLVNIINSVGYPNPDRSHFRSMDIWHTASDSKEYLSTGWLGRYLDSNCNHCDLPYAGIEIDDSLSLSMKGSKQNSFAMSKPKQVINNANNPFLKNVGSAYHDDHDHEEVAYLYKTMIDTQSSAQYLFEQSKLYKSKITYPSSHFGRDLKLIAELMTADTDTKIYYVTLSGFDTHANQLGQQEKLLKTYSEGVKAFVSDLKQNNLMDDTLLMTFSEFGRRVKQNASRGTDHGTANNVFLIGGNKRFNGIYNAAPSLSNLDDGDLIYDLDFRRIYAAILQDWLEADPTQILGKMFDPLKII